MGTGRKTYTYTLDERKRKVVYNSWGSGGGKFRGLNKADLAGVIFGCSQQTFKECVNQLIFGLPAPHFGYVQNIGLGMPLFLFNYSDRKLHGTFEAASPGQMNINPYSWTEGGAEKTQFPAQVRVCIRQHCEPLSEFTFRNAISANCYTNTHFWFELDHSQVDTLVSIFLSRPMNRYSEINFQNVSEVGVFQSKKVPSYFSGWQTSSSGTSQDSVEIGLEGTNSGDWTMVSQKGKDLSYGKVDAWKESSESSSQDDENCKNIASTAVNSDFEKEVSGDLTNKRTSPVLLDNKSESVGRGLTSNQLVANGSDGNRELLVLEKLKRLATNRQNSSNSPKSDTSVKDFNNNTDYNNNTTIAGPLQKFMEQMQLEMAELRYYAEQTRNGFPSAMEIKELRNKNALLEQKQIEMDLELQSLKEQVKGLEQLIERRGVIMTKDELPEQPESFEPSIFLLGGHDKFSWLGTLDSYLPQTDTIKSLAPMSSARSYAAATILEKNIYVFGGGNGSLWYDSVERYDPESNSWTTCPTMTRERGSLAGACLDSKIFALGGGNGVEYFSDVEMFDPFLGRWLPYGNMLQKRFALAGAVLGGALYAVGGFDGKQYLKSVERFDPREAQWVQVEEMNSKRGSLSAVVLNEKIYAMGGFDGTKLLSSVEVFDPRADSWLMTDPLACPRGYGATAVLGDSIYLIGGLGETEYVDSVECYRDGVGWEVHSLNAVGKRSFLAAVVL